MPPLPNSTVARDGVDCVHPQTNLRRHTMLAQSDKLGSFAHGYTHSGHPVTTAVALEVLEVAG